MKQPKLELISFVLCPYVQRSVIVLLEKKSDFIRTDIDLSNPPEWFKQLSPMGRVPMLIVDKQKPLFESAVICEYLDEITPESLHSIDPYEKAYHRSWIEFGSGVLNSIGSLYSAPDELTFEKFRLEIEQKFQRIEAELGDGPYFSGSKFHLVDAVYASIFRYFDVFDQFVDLNVFSEMPKTIALRLKLGQRNSVKQAVVAEYPELLLQFLRDRNSYISSLIKT